MAHRSWRGSGSPSPSGLSDNSTNHTSMPRHWTINGRFLTQKLTGVQRYGREIVRDGKETGALAGRLLRSGRDTETVAIPAG